MSFCSANTSTKKCKWWVRLELFSFQKKFFFLFFLVADCFALQSGKKNFVPVIKWWGGETGSAQKNARFVMVPSPSVSWVWWICTLTTEDRGPCSLRSLVQHHTNRRPWHALLAQNTRTRWFELDVTANSARPNVVCDGRASPRRNYCTNWRGENATKLKSLFRRQRWMKAKKTATWTRCGEKALNKVDDVESTWLALLNVVTLGAVFASDH